MHTETSALVNFPLLRSIPSGQASAQMRQSTPCVACTQALGLMRGTKRRFNRLISPIRAPSGQKLRHQRRSTSSSKTRNAAKIKTSQPDSLNWNNRESAITTAKVRPTGQIKQNTGKPNTALEARAPARTVKGPASAACRFCAATFFTASPALQLEQPAHDEMPHVSACLSCVGCAGRPICRCVSSSATSSSFSRLRPPVFRNCSKRETDGTGQSQPQKKRPKITTSTKKTARAASALGKIVFSASIVSRAPKGQIAAISFQPKEDNVPHPVCQIVPTTVNKMKATGISVRSQDDFRGFFIFEPPCESDELQLPVVNRP